MHWRVGSAHLGEHLLVCAPAAGRDSGGALDRASLPDLECSGPQPRLVLLEVRWKSRDRPKALFAAAIVEFSGPPVTTALAVLCRYNCAGARYGGRVSGRDHLVQRQKIELAGRRSSRADDAGS